MTTPTSHPTTTQQTPSEIHLPVTLLCDWSVAGMFGYEKSSSVIKLNGLSIVSVVHCRIGNDDIIVANLWRHKLFRSNPL